MTRLAITILLVCLLLPTPRSQAESAVALFYGADAPLEDLKAFDIVVVDPDHQADPKRFRKPYSELYAYVAIGEAHPGRDYFVDIPDNAHLSSNPDWGSLVIDLSFQKWPDFVAERIIAPLWDKGYRGFFLDTLDSYRLAKKFDENAQQAGLVKVIEKLHQQFPGIHLILNRGFEVVPRVKDKIQMVAAESLFQGWDASNKRYVEVKTEDREWLLGQLLTIRDQYKLPILAIDYVSPNKRALTRATAERIKSLGIVPWVADSALVTLGIGQREVMPRKIAIIYNARETPSLNFSGPHRFLEMPINYLGYLAEYYDINESLPKTFPPSSYAGIIFWGTGAAPYFKRKNNWIGQQIALGTRLLFLKQLPSDGDTLKQLGITRQPIPDNPKLQIATIDAIFQGEAQIHPSPQDIQPIQIQASGKPLLTLADQKGTHHVAAALMPWGGFVLEPYLISELPGVEQFRWYFDPFAFLSAALQLPVMPVPDVTTENGRRLLLAHIDGDGFPSRAERPGSPLAGKVLLEEILMRYRIPHAMSIIEAEVAPHGLHPKDSPEMENIAKSIFSLQHVEIASHTFSHPFRWDDKVKHGIFSDSDADTSYHLAVPGYKLDLNREIAGSVAYINERLAPAGKKVVTLQWSGDTAPGVEALRIAENANLLNMNGGDTQISRTNPSLTAVAPIGIRKNGYLQIYAPDTNENIYTNLWTGPFYGYRRVIETFEMTDSPRRLKPIGIYYHSYSASKKASLTALNEVYQWALSKEVHPVFPSEYIRKAIDFGDMVIAREGSDWRIRGNDNLRTLRMPFSLGHPDIANSRDVAGYNAGAEGNYVHLASGDALLRIAQRETSHAYLRNANARLASWAVNDKNLKFSLKGHQLIEFSLADSRRCSVNSNGSPLFPSRTNDNIQYFRLNDAAATIEAQCHRR